MRAARCKNGIDGESDLGGRARESNYGGREGEREGGIGRTRLRKRERQRTRGELGRERQRWKMSDGEEGRGSGMVERDKR